MLKVRAMILGLLILGVSTMVAVSQEKEKDFPKKDGEKGKFEFKKDGDKGAPRGTGLIPPFLRQQLKLTEEQERKISDIEKQAREAMLDVLTKEQREILMNFAKKDGGFPKKDFDGKGKEGEKGDFFPKKDGERRKEGDKKDGERRKEGDKKDGDRPPFEKK